jgi:hypothetical protein
MTSTTLEKTERKLKDTITTATSQTILYAAEEDAQHSILKLPKRKDI